LTRKENLKTDFNSLVSALVTTYNGECYVERAVESLLNQTYTNIEIIVIDDASQDKTKQLLNKKYEKNQKVKIINLEKNCGLGNACKLGVQKANGKFFIRCDDDDFLNERIIEKSVEVFNEYPDVSFVYSDYYLVDENKKITGYVLLDEFSLQIVNHPGLIATGVVFKTEDILDAGGYDGNLRCQEIYDLYIRLCWLKNKKGKHLNEKLFYYTRRSNQITSNNERLLSANRYISLKYNLDEKKLINTQDIVNYYVNIINNFGGNDAEK